MSASVIDSGTRFLRIIAIYCHDAHFVFLQQHTLFGSFFAFIHTYVPRSNFQKMPAPFFASTYHMYVRTDLKMSLLLSSFLGSLSPGEALLSLQIMFDSFPKSPTATTYVRTQLAFSKWIRKASSPQISALRSWK